MSNENNDNVQRLEQELAKAQAVTEKLEARLNSMDEAEVNAKFDTLHADIDQKDKTIAELQQKLEEITANAEKSAETVASLEKSNSDLNEQLVQANEKLTQIEAENIRTDRISALVSKGVDKADAETIVDTFSNVTAEQFDAIVDQQSALVEARKHMMHDEEEDEKKKKAMKAKAEEKSDDQALAEAEEAAEPALVTQPEDSGDAVFASLQTYFNECLNGEESK